MKRYSNILAIISCFVIALVGILFMDTKVKAATYPSSLSNVTKNGTLKYNGYDQMYYKKSGSYHVFCTKFHIPNVGTSCKLASSQWSEPVQAGVAAIVNKYNSSKSQKNYYYSELAINEFLYYYNGKNSKNLISTVRDVRNTSGVKSFYDAAVSAYNKANKKFDFKITNSKLTFTESGNYYVSNKITVKDTNGYLTSYTPSVSGAKGAEIYKKSGNSFYVRVPKDSVAIGKTVTVTLSVKGTKSYSVSKNFDCGSNNQTLTPNVTTTSTKNGTAKISGKITKKGNKVTIYKRITGKTTNLAGATLVLKDSKGKVIATWTSTTKGKEFTNLEPGKYTLSETKAPEGYNKATKDVTFTVALDNKTQSIVINNTQKKVTVVKALKIDAKTKKALAGATLEVKDSKGKLKDSWVSTEKEHTVKTLTPGTYTLSETKAPKGYKLSTAVKKFTVANDDKTVTLKFENSSQNLTVVKALKIDAKTKKALAGATLVVKDANGKEVDKWVSTEKEHVIENLAAGKYTLSETKAPEGYVLNKESKEFTVDFDDKTISLQFENEAIVTETEILKVDSETGKALAGATLVVKDTNGKVRDTWVSTTETHKITGLEAGKYTLTETIAPTGYILNEESVTFEVKYDGNVTKVQMKNTKEPEPETPKARISKQDATTGKELPGATLVIKNANGEVVKTWVSTTEPQEFELEAGVYTLSETIAPEGYQLKTETIEFEVKADGTVTEVVMYNVPEKEPVPDVPEDTPKYKVRISKQDVTTKTELPGATLVIKDSEGKEIARWVSSNTPKEIELPAGDYTLTEIKAPVGYDLSYEVISFTVKADNTVTTDVLMYNSQTPDTADKNIILIIIGFVAASFGSIFGFKKFKKQL